MQNFNHIPVTISGGGWLFYTIWVILNFIIILLTVDFGIFRNVAIFLQLFVSNFSV